MEIGLRAQTRRVAIIWIYKMQRLVDLEFEVIGRGDVLRLPAKYPYEEIVDFMVILTSDAERPIGIMVATGYSSGNIIVRLPPEAVHPGTVMLSTEWVRRNWNEWIYLGCSVEDVVFFGKYPAPENMS